MICRGNGRASWYHGKAVASIGLVEDLKALFLEPVSGQCYIAIWVIFYSALQTVDLSFFL